MNNRNTVGEAIFIRDTRTFPAPEDDDPLPGSLRLADASGNWAQSLPSGPMPAAAQSAAAASIPVAAGTAGGAIALSRAGTIASGTGGAGLLGELAAGARLALRRFGAFGIASTAYELGQRENQRAWNAPEDYMEQEALRYGGVDGFDSRQMEIYDNAVERLRAGTAQGHVRGDFYQQMDSYRRQRKTAMLLSSSARVTDAEAEAPWPCNVGPYREVRKNCAGEAHHIVPDMALHYGTRAEGMRGQNRIQNAPSFQDGIAICLSRPMHYGLHGTLNVELRRLGNGNPSPDGTAPMDTITQAATSSISAIPGLSADCKQVATTMSRRQMFGIGSQPGWTTITLPGSAARAVLQRGFY